MVTQLSLNSDSVQFYLHTLCFIRKRNELYLTSRSWYSFTDPGGIEGDLGVK